VHCRMCSSIPGLYPLAVNNTSPHIAKCPRVWVSDCPQLKTTGVERRIEIGCKPINRLGGPHGGSRS
jgi:hypothetical protein